MARKKSQLTDVKVKSLTEKGRYGDGGGLFLVIDDADLKRWMFRFQLRGRRRDMGLGPYPTVKLKDARQRAAEARIVLERGGDPIEARRRPEGVPTFGEAADDLIKTLAPTWRGRETEKSWQRSFDLYAKKLRPLPIDQVSTHDVLGVLKPLWSTKHETAGKLRERMERVLDAAKAKGFRTDDNPARWRGHLSHMLPPRQKLTRGHHKALPYAGMPAFMGQLRQRDAMSALALDWTILTASRETMTLEATWREIQGDLWVIPAARMKIDGTDHRVPLSAACLAILDKVRQPSQCLGDFIFPSGRRDRPMSNTAMDNLLRRMAVDVTPHGFRSTFRDWAGDCTDHAREVAEAALAHVVGDDAERAYRRGDALEKRRKLMDDWATFCFAARAS